jgi:Na+:H+ antiporter, NhaA family
MLAPLSLGIVLGLLIGKQLGIVAFVVAANRAGIVQLPADATRRQVYGVAVLCGIGFTMSLFIGLLAFADIERESMVKLAVLTGSLLSAFAGAVVLLWPERAAPARA